MTSEKVDTLKKIIADVPTPTESEIGIIRTDEEEEFAESFQELLDELAITQEYISPGTPQYNGVAERALGRP